MNVEIAYRSGATVRLYVVDPKGLIDQVRDLMNRSAGHVGPLCFVAHDTYIRVDQIDMIAVRATA